MGQSASSDRAAGSATSAGNTSLELFSRKDIIELFRWRFMRLLSESELALISQKLNTTTANDANTIVTYSDLAYLLQLLNDKSTDVSSVHAEFAYSIKVLYGSLKVLGCLPFLQDCLDLATDSQLTLNGLVIAALVHTGRISKVWSLYDYLKLVFMSLALSSVPKLATMDEKSMGTEEKTKREFSEEPYVVEALKLPRGHLEDVSLDTTAKRIQWETFKPLIRYDDLEVESMEVSAYDLVEVFTLLLIVYSVPQKAHVEMQQQLQTSIVEKWSEFHEIALELVRYLSIDVTSANLKTEVVTFSKFEKGIKSGFGGFVSAAFKRLFKHGFLSLIVAECDGKREDVKEVDPRARRSSLKFEETRLVTNASVAYISIFLNAVGAGVTVSPSNLVELYNGSHSGFSIRSLELSIFKWQAPTVFVISGKRLRSKTIATNKRYQQFDSEYPRYFRSTEEHNRNWQSDLDKVSYLVYVNQPWRYSNKKNFGDEKTAIMCMLPRYDFFLSKPDPVQQGQLIYFNNLGMGLGFGNEQPVNKNNIRKFLPGSVSLTVEANLEFGIFRHIANPGAHTPTYFHRSEQETVSTQDYEDRFMITDLEVWGVGSSKELEEQKKQWEWEEKQAKARQGVNMRNLGEDRAFLEMAGLVGGYGGGSM